MQAGGVLALLPQEISQPPEDGITRVQLAQKEGCPLLLASSWDRSVRVYDYEANVLKETYRAKDPVLDCAFLGTTSQVVCGGIGCELVIFDLETGAPRTVGAHEEPIRSISVTPSGTIFTGGWDCAVRLWDPRMGTPLISSWAHPERVYAMDVVPSRDGLVVGTAGGHIWLWDVRHAAGPIQRRESPLKHQTRCIAAFPDGEGFALSSTEGRVAMEYIDMAPDAQARKYIFKCHRQKMDGLDHAYPVNAVAFDRVRGCFATAGGDGYVCIWDGVQKRRLARSPQYDTSISSVSFSADGSRLGVAVSYTFERGEQEKISEKLIVMALSE